MKLIILAIALAAAACGQVEPDSPTAPSSVPAPSLAPAPAPPSNAVGRVQATITPNPVPYSGQPITDVASCRDRPHTWFYDQVLRETGGTTGTSNPNIRIAANGSTTIRTRWCSASPSAHTARTNFSGTDANGRTWTVTGAEVRLSAR
jgi:hypothetical protein